MLNNSSYKQYKPQTRNQHIKSISSCPPSTPNRIVFLPKMDGVGFKCKFGKFSVDGSINPDQYQLSRYSPFLKDQVYSNILTLNNNCYNEWRQNKQKIEINPMRVENYQILGLVVICIIYIITFYVFFSEQEGEVDGYEVTVFYAYIIFIFVIIGLNIMVLLQVFFKKYEIQNLDIRMNEVIGKSLQEFNKTTEFRLKWVKLDKQHWIYVKIPDGAPLDRDE